MPKSMSSKTTKSPSLEDRIVAFAEQVGWIAGFTKAKTEGLLDRSRLTDQLTRIRDEASTLLAHLQAQSEPPVAPPSPAKAPAEGNMVHAPGKRHRAPVPSPRGVKHSHQEIAKAKLASTLRRRGRG